LCDVRVDNLMDELLREIEIVNELGLHARAAAKLAGLAQKASARVWIIKGDEQADASSVIDILTLACPKGSIITVKIEKKSDLNVLEDIAKLAENGFNEDELC